MAGKILVVEDEAMIRLGLVGLLEDGGIAAYEAANADQAIPLLRAHSDIRLVVTDVDMPGSMDGIKLAHFIRGQWPEIGLIVVSGKIGIQEAHLPTGVPFVTKPYGETSMLKLVESLLV